MVCDGNIYVTDIASSKLRNTIETKASISSAEKRKDFASYYIATENYY